MRTRAILSIKESNRWQKKFKYLSEIAKIFKNAIKFDNFCVFAKILVSGKETFSDCYQADRKVHIESAPIKFRSYVL